MRYKRSSRIARHFLSPKFWPFGSKREFFNRHSGYHLKPTRAGSGESPKNPLRACRYHIQIFWRMEYSAPLGRAGPTLKKANEPRSVAKFTSWDRLERTGP